METTVERIEGGRSERRLKPSSSTLRGSGGPCEECGTTTSSNWRTTPEGKRRGWCTACYKRHRKRLLNEREHKCVECGSSTSSEWHSHGEKRNALCHACYHRARKRRNNSIGRKCDLCESKKSNEWYAAPSGKPSAFICNSCWNKARLERAEHGKVCKECGATSSSFWRTPPSSDGKPSAGLLCHDCSIKHKRKVQSQDDFECEACGRTESSAWFTAPSGKAHSLCSSCSNKRRAENRNAEKRVCESCPRTKSSNWYSGVTGTPLARCAVCYQAARTEINKQGVDEIAALQNEIASEVAAAGANLADLPLPPAADFILADAARATEEMADVLAVPSLGPPPSSSSTSRKRVKRGK